VTAGSPFPNPAEYAAQVILNQQSIIQETLPAFCRNALQWTCHVDPTGAHMKKVRKLYESSSGDRWYLIGDASGAVFIRHEANVTSGGNVEHEDIAAFLSRGEGPEQQELLRLIGTLVEEHPAHA
jgi:hypothetical protein